MTMLERSGFESLAVSEFAAPASLAQCRYWQAIQKDPTLSALNVSLRWRLDGHIRDDVVERAFQILLDRHETLRTGFRARGTEVEQVVHERAPFKLSVIDLSRLPPDRREAEAVAIGSREALRLFDLSSPPLLRTTLLRLTDRCAILVVTVHHLVTDGWSMGILAREFATIAAALAVGDEASLTELPIQYADFSRWQMALLETSALDDDVAYWRSQLRHMPAFTIPHQRQRSVDAQPSGEIRSVLLDRCLTDPLEASTRENGYSFFVTMVAALAASLHLVSRKSEIVIGTQVAGREHSDLHNVVGPFVNSVPLRIGIDNASRLDDFVKGLAATVKDAIAHEQLPCELVIERLPWTDHKGRAYVCPVNFSFERAFVESQRYGAFELVSLPSQSAGALFDLSFFAVHRPEGWRISCEANTGIYDADIAAHLVDIWRSALRAIAGSPHLALSSIDGGPALAALQSMLPNSASDDHLDEHVTARFAGSEMEFAASLLQRKLYNADKSYPGDPTLNIGARWLLNGPVDEALLNRALNIIVARHKSLRTSFRERADQLRQIVQSYAEAKARVVDLRQLPEDERLGGLELIGRDEARAPFDLSSAPLMRLTLIRLSETQSQLLLTTHHTISDCWSGGVFARDLAQIYRALAHGSEPNLAELSLEYGDYVQSQEAWIDSSRGLDCERYWLRQLAGAKLFHMPADNPPAVRPTRRGVLIAQDLPRSLLDAVESAARTQAVTFFMVGAAALAATLRSWRRSDEIMFSTQVSGRDQPALEGPIGPFCNWLPLRHQLKADMRLKDVLVHVRDTVADALEYKQLPVDYIEEKIVQSRQSGASRRSALRAINFLVLGNLSRDADAGAFSLRGMPGFSSGAKYDLNVFILHLADGWQVCCEFDPDLFEQETIVAVLNSFTVALHAFATEPDKLLSTLSLGIEAKSRPLESTLGDGDIARGDQALALSSLPASDIKPPGTELPRDVEIRMRRIWAAALEQPEIDSDQSFFELGGDSLAAARLLASINSEFGFSATLSDLFRAPTIRTFLTRQTRDGSTAASSDPRIVEMTTGGVGSAVIGINNSLVLHSLSQTLGNDRPMTAIKYFEGEAQRDLPRRALREIADDYIALIRAAQPHGPYVLFGLCVHGVLAIEIARQLRAAGETVPLVVVEDCWEPQFIRSLSAAQRWRVRFHDVGLHLKSWRRGEMTFPQLLGLYSFVRRSRLLDLAVRVGLIDRVPPKTGSVENDWWLQHLMEARNCYRCAPYDGDVMMFVSDDVPKGWGFDPAIGWSEVVRGHFETIPINGNHGDGLSRGSGAKIFSHNLRRALDHIDVRHGLLNANSR